MYKLKPKEYMVKYVLDDGGCWSWVQFTYRVNENLERGIMFSLLEHYIQFEDLLIEAGYKKVEDNQG